MMISKSSEIVGDGSVTGTSASSSDGFSTRQRKIEFHLARKPFKGIGNGDFQLETLNPTSNSLDSHKSGASLLPCSSFKKPNGSSDNFDNGLDPELCFGITIRRIGAGLENLGNTCYLNSVLQCLTYTEPLAAYLQSGKHQSSCRRTGFCALCAIQKHVSHALQSTGRILAPKDLVSNLRCISRNFRNARQEDAHEYMVNLLESMHKCCLPKGVPTESASAYEKSLVHKIFGGRLRSQVKCMQCSYCSNTFDPFLDLSLEISKADSLLKALAHFTAMEHLDGGQKQYQCVHCKQKVKALKQLTVYKAPYILAIHLKRFDAYDTGKKIDKKVLFGPSLNLKPFVSGSYEGDLKYTLYGVLVHAGWNTRSGHYFCFVRTSSGTWYSVDDNRVAVVGERTVLEQKAYMLFYCRDRKIFYPKKPVHVQKETMAVIELRNEMESASNQTLNDKKIIDANTSEAVKRDQFNGSLKKETLFIEGSSVPKINGSVEVKKDIELEVSKVPIAKEPLRGLPVKNNNVVKQDISPSPPLVAPIKGIEVDKISDKTEPVDSQSLITSKKSEVISIVNASVTSALPDKKATNTILKSSESGPKESLSPPISNNKNANCKLKRKVLKYQLPSMHIGSRILCRASLQKKKHKKLSSMIKKLIKEHLNEMEPSTSEKTEVGTTAIPSVDSRKRRVVEIDSGNVQNDNLNKKRSNSVDDGSKNDPLKREPDGSKNVYKEPIQNGSLNVITKGLEESLVAVPRWDGIDLPPSRGIGSRVPQTVSIGYVPDEWDEEYDRGKRKKVKIAQNNFDGMNPFQEIATNKTKVKNAKLNRSSSGNKPFRRRNNFS